MTSPRAAVSTALKFLRSPQLPEFSRILPSEAVFASAQKSGFLKCNRTEATKVLAEIWKTTQNPSSSQKSFDAEVANICTVLQSKRSTGSFCFIKSSHKFSPSNFTSLAILLQSSPSLNQITADLLSLAESLNDPAAVIKSAKAKITSSRSFTILEASPIFQKLKKLATHQKVPEAYELLAETYEYANDKPQAQRYWADAAEAGSGKACFVMGKYAMGKGKVDVAIQAFKGAAELGEAEAYFELGMLQMKTDKQEAERNLSVAAASGIIRAAVKLDELYRSRNDIAMSDEWRKVAEEMKAVST